MKVMNNVLIVDDRSSEVWFIDRILKNNGYATFVASNGKECIARAQEIKPDLIILDTVLPDMDGSLVYRTLQSIPVTSGTPVLFLSVNKEMDEKEIAQIRPVTGAGARNGCRPGLAGFLSKPFKAEEILASVDALFERQIGITEDCGTTKPARVLVIDDNRSLVKIVEVALQKEKYNVISAYSGLEGLQKAKSENPGLILLDIVLPELSGFKVLERLRRHTSVPVIMLTSDNNLDSVEQCLALGADGYLVKPFNARELVARVREKLPLRGELVL